MIIIITLAVTVLFINGKKLGLESPSTEEEGNGMFTSADLNAVTDTGGATEIILDGSGGTVKGNGAYISGSTVNIAYAGRYVISGELENGSVVIDADGDDKIYLLFNGVIITNEDSAALLIKQAEKVFITLADGTENSLSCGTEFSSSAQSEGIDGVIYSRDDLTINGGGTLKISGGASHGIVCNDDLVITGGTVEITAPRDGIHAGDSVRLCNAGLTVAAGDDGITVSNDENTSFFYMESGSIDITESYEGIEANSITVDGGRIAVLSSDDGLNACGNGEAVIKITGGDITVINENGNDADGFDSNGDIYIEGGNVFISLNGAGTNCALDYGSENGGVCEINGGTVLACGSSQMAEKISSASAQGFITKSYGAGSGEVRVTLTSADGEALVDRTVPHPFTLLTVSAPGMKKGDNVTLSVNGESETVTVSDSYEISEILQPSFGAGMRGGFEERGAAEPPEGAASENVPGNEPPEKPDGNNGEGFNGGGMNGQPPEKPDGGMMFAPDGEMPSMPEGEAPSKPDGEVSSMPDSGEPSVPEGEMPSVPEGGRPDNGFGRGENGFDDNTSVQQKETGQDISPEQIEILLLTAAVLTAGLIFAYFYRRK